MYTDYCFYLNKLIGTQKKKEVLIFILFWLIMLVIALILQTLYIKKHKGKESEGEE